MGDMGPRLLICSRGSVGSRGPPNPVWFVADRKLQTPCVPLRWRRNLGTSSREPRRISKWARFPMRSSAALGYSLPYIELLGVDKIQPHAQSLTKSVFKLKLPRLGFSPVTPPESRSRSLRLSQRTEGHCRRGWSRRISVKFDRLPDARLAVRLQRSDGHRRTARRAFIARYYEVKSGSVDGDGEGTGSRVAAGSAGSRLRAGLGWKPRTAHSGGSALRR